MVRYACQSPSQADQSFNAHLERDDSSEGQAAHGVRVPHLCHLFTFCLAARLALIHQTLSVVYDRSEPAFGKVQMLELVLETGRRARERRADK